MKKEKMIEVVKKLMALSQNNPSQEEAVAAALKAQELMAKYDISEIETLEKVDKNISEVEVVFRARSSHDNKAWKIPLSLIIAPNFKCEVYKQGKAAVVFYGYKQDALVAKEVMMSLYEIGNKLACTEYDRVKALTGTAKGVYNSFILGYLQGIREALAEQCTALLIVTPKEVKKGFKEKCDSAGFTTSKTAISNKSFNGESYGIGKKAGKDMAGKRKVEVNFGA